MNNKVKQSRTGSTKQCESDPSKKGNINKEKVVERKCAVTGCLKAKEALIRFALSPENEVVPDIKTKLPGRGVWLSAQKSVVAEAIKRKTFERHFAKRLKLDSKIDQIVEDLLEKAALGQLKMANKAGLLIIGFTKLMAAIEKETIIAVIHAKEASRPESEKLDYKFQVILQKNRVLTTSGHKKPFNNFETQQLSLAFGAANVIHAGLKEGGASLTAIKAMAKHVAYNE